DTAVLTGGVTDSILSGNEGDGLKIEIAGNNDAGNTSIFTAAQLNNFFITDNEFVGNGVDNRPGLNGVLADGIEIIRRERGQFNDLLISGNLITDNTENGIAIASSGVDLLNLVNMRPDSVMILNNEISDNLRDGIEFLLGSDADMVDRMDSNLIPDNGFGAAHPPAGK